METGKHLFTPLTRSDLGFHYLVLKELLTHIEGILVLGLIVPLSNTCEISKEMLDTGA